MPRDQILMGIATAAACGWAIAKRRWLLTRTRKGRWLSQRLGREGASRFLVALLAAGVVFGLLLATNVISPVRW